MKTTELKWNPSYADKQGLDFDILHDIICAILTEMQAINVARHFSELVQIWQKSAY